MLAMMGKLLLVQYEILILSLIYHFEILWFIIRQITITTQHEKSLEDHSLFADLKDIFSISQLIDQIVISL